MIIDVGANMNAKAEDLYQYGIMGAIYAETILGVTNPRIGLLNVGTEDEKGTELTRSTRALYQNSPWAGRFVGNVEGRDIYEGHVRVVICDGFVGNVLLKAGEGAVEFLFSTLREELARLMRRASRRRRPPDRRQPANGSRRRFEYEEFGGGPLLGIRGACIICHGASGARAIKNALRVAGTMAEDRLAHGSSNSSVVRIDRMTPPSGVTDRQTRRARARVKGVLASRQGMTIHAQDRLLVSRPGGAARRHGPRARPRAPGRPRPVRPGR